MDLNAIMKRMDEDRTRSSEEELMAKMKWRRGTFEINLTKRARADGGPDHMEGWISEPFAVHINPELGVPFITHLPTGARIYTQMLLTVAQAKRFAALLLEHAGSHDWNGPKGANPKKTVPGRKSAWFRSAEKVWWEAHRSFED